MTFDDVCVAVRNTRLVGRSRRRDLPGRRDDGDGSTLRVRDAVQRLLETHAGSHVAIACHGGVVDAVFRLALGQPGDRRVRLAHVEHVADRIRFTGGTEETWRLVRYNDSAHLTGLPAATERATTA